MIERTEHDGIVTLRMNRGKANALDLELVEALARGIAEADDAEARALVITGSGSIFSAGVDLVRVLDGGRDYVERFIPAMSRMMLDLFALQTPVVAAINGHAIAGGAILAAACDVRVMAAGNARIGLPELHVGVPFPPATIEILRFAWPPHVVQSIIFSSEPATAEQAKTLALVDELVEAERLLPRAIEVARGLAEIPREAFRLTKRQLRERAIRHAKHFAHEFDPQMLELWSSGDTMTAIRKAVERMKR
ncbi:MAG: enoyl-CoA hydratase/isomerase family protein [Thermoanaerobaculia bacterium]